MVVAFQNNYKLILDKLKSVLRTEFKNMLPVYVGADNTDAGSQYLRLEPIRSDLLSRTASSETREHTVELYLYYAEPNVNERSLDQVLRITSRIEALLHDNAFLTLSDGTNCVNCRIEFTTLNAQDNANEYVVLFQWKAQHTGNFS